MTLHWQLGCTFVDLTSAQASFTKEIRYGIKWNKDEKVDFFVGFSYFGHGEVSASSREYTLFSISVSPCKSLI